MKRIFIFLKKRKTGFNFFLFLLIIGMVFINSCQKNEIVEGSSLYIENHLVNEQLAIEISEELILPDGTTFLKSSSTDKDSKEKKKISTFTAVQDKNKNNAFFITNYEKGGFVILSADDRISPIVAYSSNEKIPLEEEEYSPALGYWFQLLLGVIEEVRSTNEPANSIVQKEWDNLITSRIIIIPPNPGGCENEYELVGPLLSTTWHQGCGFNSLLPMESEYDCTDLPCGRVYAGCVPIAIAQVMKFFEYPNTYDWDLMPNFVGSNETSTLIEDLHDNLPINYYCTGTGVSSSYNIASTFTSDYNYSNAIQASYNHYSVKNNLRSNKPVLLSGSNS